MKSFFFITALLICLLSALTAPAQERKDENHKFNIEEINRFHELLHPVWHEQYPKKEWTRIRSQAGEFVSRKDAIMKVRLRTKADNRAAVEERRQAFGAAVDAFARAAKSGSDDELSRALAEMHDRFEQFTESLK
ncbi:MAG TPA: hypothetical protein VNQ79_24295 [Blastocatellia bacterium]|nr:hypothetical protein [Blastocatellia bacterium]